MKAKLLLKKRVINFRENGMSFSEILRKVPIARSTLSLWIRPVPFIRPTKSVLRRKLLRAGKLGAEVKKRQRENKTEEIKKIACLQIGEIDNNKLLILGTMLYWAEGTKETDRSIGQQVAFANSDPLMCRLFIKWVKDCFQVTEDRIVPSIYIHISRKDRVKEALEYWSMEIGVPKENFKKTSFTDTKLSKYRQRKGRENYFGQLRIRIRKSTDLNRRIGGLIEGVCVRCGVVSG